MGQAALKSRSHRRYYLNKVLPFLSSAARFFFHLARRAGLTGIESIDAIVRSALKEAQTIIRDFDESGTAECPIRSIAIPLIYRLVTWSMNICRHSGGDLREK